MIGSRENWGGARPRARVPAFLAWASASLLLTGCAWTSGQSRSVDAPIPGGWLASGRAAAERGDWAQAQSAFAQALREDVGNGYLQSLNGFSYDQLSSKDGTLADYAAVAYDNARALAPGQYWASLMHGFLALRRNQPERAVPHFARAALDEDARWEASYGLASAAYFSGDLLLAELATRHALQSASDRPEVQRLSAMVRAAAGDEDANTAVARYAALGAAPAEVARVERRVQHLLRLAADTSQETDRPDSGEAATPSEPAVTLDIGAPPQISVDVSIILSSVLKNERRGVNLLDALSVTYSMDRSISRSVVEETGSDPFVSAVRTITHNIGIPQLNYNLNLFNNSGQSYSVLARPSLTAYLEETSDFFSGRTVNVQVSGVNLGQLQPIDVGVGLRITPQVITAERAIIQIEASRSFLSQEEIGRFDQSLTTFKQEVAATADIAFGETLILSALSETVRDSTVSQVPILGDIPILSAITRERDTANREESLLVLVTPQRPTTANLGIRGPRAEDVQRLMRYWTARAKPTSGFEDVLRRLEHMPIYRGAEKSDLYSRLSGEPQLVQRALEETYELAARDAR